MTLFVYDGTFEGLLTAVFDAYARRTRPDSLIRNNQPVPLFADVAHRVVTQPDRAGRVWTALERRMPKNSCNMLMHVWLSETEEAGPLLFRILCKLFDNGADTITDYRDQDMLTARQLARRTAREAEMIRQFVRFQLTSDGIYFAPVSPLCNALPLAIDHFADRFSDQAWVIYDTRRHYGYHYDLTEVRPIAFDGTAPSDKLDPSQLDAHELLFQSLWKNYFNAMSIKERINPRLQRQHMPVRFWRYLPEKRL